MGVDDFKGQKYDKIRKECLKSGHLFTDPEFPPAQKSLFYTRTDDELVWKRPTDLCNVPKFVIDGVSCDDLVEGELGNRWFVASCASLANQKQLFSKVVIDAASQEFNQASYVGMFKFQFWVYGKWIEVVIDDHLPTRHGKLVFCHSKSKNEFWCAFLEKAYAKLFGDYESLSLGCAVDALVDFTGGVAERHAIACEQSQDDSSCFAVYKLIEDALASSALLLAEVRVMEAVAEEQTTHTDTHVEGTDVLVLDSPNKQSSPPATQAGGGGDSRGALKTGYFRSGSIVRDGFAMDCGLLNSHGYIVRQVHTISIQKGEQLRLVRLQSPWQTGEWKGSWSNVSPEMKRLSAQEKAKLGLKFETETEFWMLMSDFMSNYTHLDVCHFFNINFHLLKKTWDESLLTGNWVNSTLSDSAGGNSAHPTFLRNPQYIFDVNTSMDGCVMVSLEQNDRTIERKGRKGAKNLTVGFTIMKVEENRKYRLHRPGDIIATSMFTDDRSVFCKSPMLKGRYVIVPSTQEPGHSGAFLLRLYNSSGTVAKEVVKDEPVKSMCSSGYSMAVQLTILKAEGLAIEKGLLNPYCVVKCEGESYKTAVMKETDAPVWNTKYIFYKKTTEGHKDYPVTIQVLSSKTVGSTALGEATLRDLGDCQGKSVELSLYQRSKKKDQPDIELPAKLYVHVFSSDNLSEF